MNVRTWSNLSFLAILTYMAILLGLAIGWIMNIVKIVGSMGDAITGFFIARLAGTVVFPLGGVLGYF